MKSKKKGPHRQLWRMAERISGIGEVAQSGVAGSGGGKVEREKFERQISKVERQR